MKKPLLYLLTAAAFLASCSKKSDPEPTPEPTPTPVTPVTPYEPDNSFKIVAYMPSYQDPAKVTDAKYKMVTHLLYSFLSPNVAADGSLNALPEAARFSTVRAKAKAFNVKFGVSIGGAESKQETFAAIAQSTTARANFIKNVVNFAKNNNIDGIDMDWEYPRTTSTTDVNPNASYTLLMKELSAELHKNNKFLSASITPGVYVSSNRHAISPEVYPYVDFFNIMQYDGGVGYDSAEPLNHASMKMTEASLTFWLTTKGMPKEKAILGMPCYGRDGSGAAISYTSIIASSKANANVNSARVGVTDYGYNGIPMVKQKTQMAKDRCNGIMFWEFAQDTVDDTSLIKAANDQLGRAY
ncbi:glycosyl hydrolase family 18 protein [Pedobacter sp.]